MSVKLIMDLKIKILPTEVFLQKLETLKSPSYLANLV